MVRKSKVDADGEECKQLGVEGTKEKWVEDI